jgi:TATA-box binding protein (TBP) (component of TFIID and TFIIIB)
MDFKVVNMVFTGDLGERLNLKYIKTCYPDTKYNPGRFNGLSMKLKQGSALLFVTGKVVFVGQKSEAGGYESAEQMATDLRRLGYVTRIKNMTLVNVVGANAIGRRLDLERFVCDNKPNASLELELFPGLKLRIDGTQMVATIFPSGKYYITGGRDMNSLTKAIIDVHESLLARQIKCFEKSLSTLFAITTL